MSEPLSFTASAQLYTLDKVQKTWTPLSDSVLPVVFFGGEPHRIKSTDPVLGVLIDVSILANTVFKRSGEAFVQWYDPASKHMFGLNLKAKSDAGKIEEFFVEGQKKAPKIPPKKPEALPPTPEARAVVVQNNNTAQPNLTVPEKEKEASVTGNAGESSNIEKESSQASLHSPQPQQNVSITSEVAATNIEPANVNPNPKKKTTVSDKLMDYVASLESQIKDANTDSDPKYIQVLETKIGHLEEKIQLLEQTNVNLRETIDKTGDAMNKQLALVTKDNQLLKVALQQSSLSADNYKKQMQAYQEVNAKLTEKLTSLSKLYDSIGEILSRP